MKTIGLIFACILLLGSFFVWWLCHLLVLHWSFWWCCCFNHVRHFDLFGGFVALNVLLLGILYGSFFLWVLLIRFFSIIIIILNVVSLKGFFFGHQPSYCCWWICSFQHFGGLLFLLHVSFPGLSLTSSTTQVFFLVVLFLWWFRWACFSSECFSGCRPHLSMHTAGWFHS